MKDNLCILKGNIVHTPTMDAFRVIPNGYLVAENGVITYCGTELPGTYQGEAIKDYGDKLIIPGFVDVHAHAPQFYNRGLGMDKELLPWLETYTFPEEAKFADLEYARVAYSRLVGELKREGTTRSILFASLHQEGTLLLMELLKEAGLSAFVGKVNMDRNAPDYLRETTEESIESTLQWLEKASSFGELVKPIITPRFVPSCTSELMTELGKMALQQQIPVQSHLSENRSEIEWVTSLHPECANYASVYEVHGLLGQTPTVMAHCIHLTDEEIESLAKTGTMVAHCPYSNNNLASGIAPIRKLLSRGVTVGLGSDISGGHELSMAKVITEAVQLSKLKWAEVDAEYEPLSLSECFYLGTAGGGQFFGKVGCFETGFALDALIIDDKVLQDPNPRSLVERLERWLYIGDDRQIVDRYVSGNCID